ncbi:hypothetical protein [Polaribacter sp. MED152]|uniref:hypothetical protein n=1 Tax=Polaribacter sp. MED152 TaxID=313598 RepID=UPI000068C933|nr:hypothetical protein [Polaribacter sp. MED152]EAQ43219.1 hypothetical protein MED152_10855 [Polaribacter sp. MED152]
MQARKNKIIIIFVLATLCIGFGSYTYFKNSSSTNTQTIQFTGTTEEFYAEIHKDPLSWTNKTVSLKGRVTFITATSFTLNSQAFCKYQKLDKPIKLNQKVTIKGKVAKYDSLMGDLFLEQCVILSID